MTGRRSLAPSRRALAVGYCLALAVTFAPQCDATAAARLRGLGRCSPPSEQALSRHRTLHQFDILSLDSAFATGPNAVAISNAFAQWFAPGLPQSSPAAPPPPLASPSASNPFDSMLTTGSFNMLPMPKFPLSIVTPGLLTSPPSAESILPPPLASSPPSALNPPVADWPSPIPALVPSPPPTLQLIFPPLGLFTPLPPPPPPAVSPPPPAISPPPPAVSPPPPAVSRPPALRSPAPPQPSAPPPSVDVTAVLSKINDLRARHGAAALTWSPTLERFAQSYADRCLFEHSNGPYGETLGLGNIITVIDQWYEEICIYNYNQPGWSPRTGHFTQLIWAKTTRLGCAVGNCPSGSRDNSGNFFNGPVVVCEWDPWGNGSGFSTNARPLLPGATNICAAGK